jgi:hypothetical protein
LKRGELQKLRDEEGQASDTDLTEIRKKWLDELAKKGIEAKSQKDVAFREAEPIRNHGLFSKAERALSIAGWSEGARRDIEVFRLVDVEGLTPLLEVLNEDGALLKAEPDKATA